MKKYQRYITLTTLAALVSTSPLFAENVQTLTERLATLQKDEGYTVNFKDVTALEVVKFLSKIGNLNFIYNEADLNFQITMTSEGEASLPSVLSAFLQVIQVNGLSVIEDGKNIIIVNKEEAKPEIGPVFTDQTNALGQFLPGVLTRVFTVTNSDPQAVSTVITELLSKNAIVTMVRNSRKVIVTDVIANINKVTKLLEELDSPVSTLQLKTYTPKYENAAQLEELLRQFLTPISEGNPVILTSQNGGKSLYMMSTPFLIQEATKHLKQIDSKEASGGSVLVHKLEYQSYDTLKASLQEVVKGMSATGSNEGLEDAVNSMRFIPSSNSIVFTGSRGALQELKNLLANLDSESSKNFVQTQQSDFFVYKLKSATEEQIETAIEHVVERLKKSHSADPRMLETLEQARYISETHSVLFTGPEDVLAKVQALMPTLDVSPDEATTPFKKLPPSTDFYIYHPKTHNGDALLDSLEEMGDSLKDSGLADSEFLHTLETAKYNEASNSLSFTGTKASIDRIKSILPNIDSAQAAFSSASNYYIYRPKGLNGEKLLEELKTVAKNFKSAQLQDKQLITTLNNARYNSSTNSLIFTGTPQSIAEIKSLIPTVEGSAANVYLYKIENTSKASIEDGLKRITEGLPHDSPLYVAVHTVKYLPASHSLAFQANEETKKQLQDLLTVVDQVETSNKAFRIIQLTNVSGKVVLEDTRDMVKNLKHSGGNEALIEALESARYIPSTDSVYISGSTRVVEEAAKIIQGFDIPVSQRSGNGKVSFGLYKLTNSAGPHVMEEIREMIKHMQSSDVQEPALLQALQSARYVRSSNAIYFTGTQEVIPQVREIIENFDDEGSEAKRETYSLYKLKAANGELVMEDLRKMRSNLHSSGIHDEELIKSLESARYVAQTNSIYFTGTKESIAEMNQIIGSFDTPRSGQNTAYYMYRPVHGTPESVKQNMIEIAEELRASGLADSTLINSIRRVKIVDSSDSLIFTGSPQNIEEIKQMIQGVDNPQHQIKSVGSVSFIVYKIQHTPANQLIAHSRSVAADLKASDSKDKDLIRTLETVRYIKESNSLVFTGTKASLDKALTLMNKFDGKDSTGPQAPAPEEYVIYKPVNMSGEELIQTLKDFQQNLVASGVDQNELYSTINNLRWMPRTSSILVSGNADATKKVIELLKRFDVPGNDANGAVDTVADSSFLIYKVQYHQGSEIEQALSGIAKDLATSGDKERNKKLIEAINSLQWIEITNSIVGTGDSQTLARLRELIKNIDVPLKQVFIEVLVLETSSTDELDFGLTWGSQGVYRNRLGYGFGAQPKPATTTTSTIGSQFLEKLQGLNATTKPTGADVPLTSGGDLGVLGDIILHKGTSYFALGSLVRALQSDGDSTIVLNQKIITQDNKESTIFVGNNIPYAGSVVQTTQNAGTQTNTNLEYRDIGVNLSIKPTVGSDGVITMTINQDISEEEEDLTGDVIQTGQVNGIRTSKTTTQTRVTMPDNAFLAISGMIRNQTTHVKTGLPCLGGLPILGAAFSENQRTKKTQNVVIFIKPRIINTFDEYKDITTNQEDTYRSMAQPENFDAAIELVKTPDDD